MDIDIEIVCPILIRRYIKAILIHPLPSRKSKRSRLFRTVVPGRVIIYPAPSPAISRVVATSLSYLAFAFIVVGCFVRHMIIKPLEKLGQSARQIAEEDLGR